jgi:hypothetical protein
VRLTREQLEEREAKRVQEERHRMEERARLTLAVAVACRKLLDDLEGFEAAWRTVVSSGYPFAGLARLVGRPDDADIVAAMEGILSLDAARIQLEASTRQAKELLQSLAAGRSAAPAPCYPDKEVEPEVGVSVFPW